MEKSMISCRGWKRSAANVLEEGRGDEYERLRIVESYKRRRTKFDIFINHRGPDGKAFASHLEEALNTRGYAPFFDQNGLGQGEHFPEAIKAAIQDACIHLAIFTPLYAESKYCLDELVDMVECVKDSGGNVKLIPIFLKVTPSSIRCVERGPFHEAFEHHKQRDRGLRIPVWKEALYIAADMMGFEGDKFKNECELKNAIIDRVEEIFDLTRVERTQWVPIRMVGREQLLGFALSKLELMGDNVAILGIWGAGGIGKTTLAKKLYNHYSMQQSFGYQAYLELGKGKDVAQLQNQVLQLLGKKERNVVETYRGYLNKLVNVRALVVVDDISYGEHFTELIPDLKKLGGGSRIILTSRDKDVLDMVFKEAPQAYHLLEMQVLDFKASFELFCVHAFVNKSIPNENHPLYPLAKKVADMCRGLPLALEMIGKHLYNRSEGEWEEEAREMSLSSAVLDILSMSYKGLCSKSDKMMFLDVACHMVGLLKEDAIDIWESCASRDSNPPCRRDRCLTSRKVKGSLQTLINKSLVKVGYDGRLTMHGLIQEMGKKMVQDETRDEKARELGQYSHLWDLGDVENVLNEEEGTKEVRGLSLVGLNGKTFMASAFRNMTEIHFLLLDGVRIEGDFSQISKKIRWMQWRNAYLSSLPLELHCSNLVVLDLTNSKSLTQLWAEDDAFQVPRFLKTLILKNCTSLEKIPENIKSLTRLRILDLRQCEKLTSLPCSLGELKGLVKLTLKGCKSLEALPDGVVKLSLLETLSMDMCVKIRNLPANFGNLGALVRFSARGASSLTALPDSFSKSTLTRLQILDLQKCEKLTSLPSSFGELKGLVNLDLTGCKRLEALPDGVVKLPLLKAFFMDKCVKIQNLPANFGNLGALVRFSARGASSLTALPDSFSKSTMTRLWMLDLYKCEKLTSLPSSLGELKGVAHLYLTGCTRLEALPDGVVKLPLLKAFFMDKCVKIRNLPANFGNLGALVQFSARGASSLTALPDSFSKLTRLRWLDVLDCKSLSQLPRSVKELTHLRVFYAHRTAIRELPSDLGDLKSLIHLSISPCNQLESLPDNFGDLEKLRNLSLAKNKLTKLPNSFKNLTHLKYLYMQGSPNLVNVESLPVSLVELDLANCPKVVRVSVKELSKLELITLCNCTSLTKLEGVEHAKSLCRLNVSGCCSLSELQIDLSKSRMTHCYVSGSGVCVKFNNDWNQGGAPFQQVVSYYDHAMGFVKNSMTRKISSSQFEDVELCMETGIVGSGVAAVVITVVAHDKDWTSPTGRYTNNLKFQGRIVRSDEGLDVEVFPRELFLLRKGDHRDQVYLCALRRSHPLIENLRHGDKLRVYTISICKGFEMTIMQGHIHVAYDEDTLEDPFQNLLLRDDLSSTLRAKPLHTVRQAFTENCSIRFTIKNSDGDLLVKVLGQIVYQPILVQVNARALSSTAVMGFTTRGRICDICEKVDLERGYHCNTCVDFDMCQSCKEVKQTVHPSEHLFTKFEAIGYNKNWGYVVNDLWWSENFPASDDPHCATMRRIYTGDGSTELNPNFKIGYIVDVREEVSTNHCSSNGTCTVLYGHEINGAKELEVKHY